MHRPSVFVSMQLSCKPGPLVRLPSPTSGRIQVDQQREWSTQVGVSTHHTLFRGEEQHHKAHQNSNKCFICYLQDELLFRTSLCMYRPSGSPSCRPCMLSPGSRTLISRDIPSSHHNRRIHSGEGGDQVESHQMWVGQALGEFVITATDTPRTPSRMTPTYGQYQGRPTIRPSKLLLFCSSFFISSQDTVRHS
jgi:hypothetical protein